MTVEARDNLGRGNRNTVELLIKVLDVNDEKPKFKQDSYEVSIAENSRDFTTPFHVHADDADENGTDNALVRYRIVSGDFNGNFTLDSVSGLLKPKGVLDFEAMEEDTFNLTIRAQDLGNPPLHSEILVIVHVDDVNDHPPEFSKDIYSATISEDAVEGSEVIRVS